MIKQNILYIPQPHEASFIGLNCNMQTMAYYSQNKMSAEVLLSQLETKVMQLFFQHFPVFVPDTQMAEALYPGQRNHLRVEAQMKKNISRVLTQLRTRIKPLDLNIRRISQTGYFLEILSCCTDTIFVSANTPKIALLSGVHNRIIRDFLYIFSKTGTAILHQLQLCVNKVSNFLWR